MADDFTPIVFERTAEDGSNQELLATNPSDVVRLRFDGWTEKKAPAAAKKPATS